MATHDLCAPSLYVYYRIPQRHVGEARAAARRAAGLIEAGGAARPRLKRRPEADPEGRETWMEVYDTWDPRWAPQVAQAVTDSGLGALIEGARHEEWFVDLDSPEAITGYP